MSTRHIEVTSNTSKRTFTIRCRYSDGGTIKYRTYPVSRDEFEGMEFMTEGDWDAFLRGRCGEYYHVN